MPSPLADHIEGLLREIDNAFVDEFQLSTPYQSEDILPGERYGEHEFFSSLDVDRDTPDMGTVRRGVEGKVFRGPMLITTAVDTTGLGDRLAYLEAKIAFAKEALNIDHGVAAMKARISGPYGMLYDIQVEGAIDAAYSQSLKDRNLWIVTATATLIFKIGIKKNQNGEHLFPIDNPGT